MASFSLIRLSNFSFLALFVIKSNRTDILKICKILKKLSKKFPDFAAKKVQNNFLSLEFCQVDHLQKIESFAESTLKKSVRKVQLT